MPLTPALGALLDQVAAANAPGIETLPLDVGRAGAIVMVQATEGPKQPVAAIEDRELATSAGAVRARVYWPARTDEPLAVVAYFHGGGWVIMGIETHDNICRRLTNATGAIVVSIEYRLAPEDPFPAALEDCVAATQWLAEHGADLGGDPRRLVVAGDSAGGNLAAATALRARDDGPDLRGQVLVYPVCDSAADTESYRVNGEGYLLTATAMAWFWDCYLGPDGDSADPYASPVHARDLTSLPPALVLTAEYDPLRDEGEAYAHRLEACDVPVTLHRFDGLIHGFLGMEAIVPEADAAMAEIGAFVRGVVRT
ncbi:MAG TPA: alpha/beta hydrolase [Acidimicrobiia bacterium]|nr:alpha/beta hydrolase [Acidimicrobiia bacterium]